MRSESCLGEQHISFMMDGGQSITVLDKGLAWKGLMADIDRPGCSESEHRGPSPEWESMASAIVRGRCCARAKASFCGSDVIPDSYQGTGTSDSQMVPGVMDGGIGYVRVRREGTFDVCAEHRTTNGMSASLAACSSVVLHAGTAAASAPHDMP